MTWNHRVVRHKVGEWEPMLAIHEVFYDEEGNIVGITQDAVGVWGLDIDELEETLERMRRALGKPTLNYDEIPGVEDAE